MLLVGTAPQAEAQVSSVDPSQQGAQDLAARLADKYDSIQTMKARFVQIATSQFMDDPERFSGLLIFSQNQYRIETSTQTIVTDGTTTWIHNRGEEQVLINDFVEDETSFSLTSFLRNFDEEYDVRADGQESLSGSQHDILFLTPRDDFSAFRSVRLWIRRRDLIVTHLVVIDLNDVTMTFDLSEITVNPELDSKTFAFQIPADVEIIDLRN
jgi:outer membrane lipoprotein-sorting protein